MAAMTPAARGPDPNHDAHVIPPDDNEVRCVSIPYSMRFIIDDAHHAAQAIAAEEGCTILPSNGWVRHPVEPSATPVQLLTLMTSTGNDPEVTSAAAARIVESLQSLHKVGSGPEVEHEASSEPARPPSLPEAACADLSEPPLPARGSLAKDARKQPACLRERAVSSGTLDLLLVRLGQLQATGPRDETWVEQFEDTAVVAARHAAREAKAEAAARRKEEGRHGGFWAKGTGYGYAGAAGTHSESELAAAAARRLERQAESIKLLQEVKALLSPPRKGREAGQLLPEDTSMRLEKSCLLPVLQAYLRTTEVDIFGEPGFYATVYSMIVCLAQNEQLVHLLGPLPGQGQSVYELMKEQGDTASDYLKMEAGEASKVKVFNAAEPISQAAFQEALGATQAAIDKAAGSTSATAVSTPVEHVRLVGSGLKDDSINLNVMSLLSATSAVVHNAMAAHEARQAAAALPAATGAGEACPSEAAFGSAGGDSAALKELYCETMKKHAFGTEAFSLKSGFRSVFSSTITSEASSMKATTTKRCKAELRSMKKNLPLSWESTVLLRHDKRRPYIMQALIFGPDNTPYDSGAFVFDIYCNGSYPNAPPHCKIITTGGGSFRFNPNLYASGKVCLSLLGTWSGGSRAEEWNKDTSTLLQVLVSIQALILVPEPAFNEPGYERQRGTKKGDELVRYAVNGGYEKLRRGTVTWAMLDQLRNPPPGFEEAVKEHFRLKRKYIMNLIEGWIAEGADSTNASHLPELTKKYEDLKVELAKLGPSPCDEEAPAAAPAGGGAVAEPASEAAGEGTDTTSADAEVAKLATFLDLMDILGGTYPAGLVQHALEQTEYNVDQAADWVFSSGEAYLAQHTELLSVPDPNKAAKITKIPAAEGMEGAAEGAAGAP